MINNLIRSIFGLKQFDPTTMGEIAPAAWNAQPKAAQQPKRAASDGFRMVASTDAGDVAFSTDLRPMGNMSFEAPVRSGTPNDTTGRISTITRADLVELAKYKVSQATAEKIKPYWASGGMSTAQIAKACGVSPRTVEAARGAFNKALPQPTAIAVVKD